MKSPNNARMDTLLSEGFSVKTFAELSMPNQLAIVWYMAVDGDAWCNVDMSPLLDVDDPKAALVELLPQFVKAYGDARFGIVCLTPAAIQKAVMDDAEISGSFSSWDEYHAWYLAAGDVPSHPCTERWPVILSSDDSETITDGWHRFHGYMRDGAPGIPAMFFPQEQHFAACGIEVTYGR